jgi:hypothetical protein
MVSQFQHIPGFTTFISRVSVEVLSIKQKEEACSLMNIVLAQKLCEWLLVVQCQHIPGFTNYISRVSVEMLSIKPRKSACSMCWNKSNLQR